MNDRDFAVIVGIQRYPAFGQTPAQANDLRGPDLDSAEIQAWLTDPTGGDMPVANIRGFRSAAYPDPFPNGRAAPRKGEVTGAFRWLHEIALQRNDRMEGLDVGHRLYVYVSGHGFARGRTEGALFMANATLSRTWHLETSAWVKWLYAATYFEEYVVWMDCCMNPEVRVRSESVGFGDVVPTQAAKMFSAYAAQWPGMSVEAEMGDGQVHGAFTWALLQGLRGAAADPATGEVRTAGLRDYLTNAMRTFMTNEQRLDPAVSNEPDFGFENDILLVKVEPSLSSIRLAFPPAAAGTAWRVLTGSPAVDVGAGIVAAGGSTLSLPTGVYIARVDGLGLSKGFEVAGADLVVDVA